MQYKTLIDYKTVSRLNSNLNLLTPGLWMLDLDPDAEAALLGPYESISEAHSQRDNLWHHGDRFGRYMWLLGKTSCELLKAAAGKIQHVEVLIDTTPMEIVSVRIKVEGIDEWLRAPRGRLAIK